MDLYDSYWIIFHCIRVIYSRHYFSFISLYKILKDPKAKKFLHEQEIKRTEKIIEKQNPIQNLQKVIQTKQNKIRKLLQHILMIIITRIKAGLFHLGVYCPYCKTLTSNICIIIVKASLWERLQGCTLTGGIGTLAGFAGKRVKNTWRCNNCGCTFKSAK